MRTWMLLQSAANMPGDGLTTGEAISMVFVLGVFALAVGLAAWFDQREQLTEESNDDDS